MVQFLVLNEKEQMLVAQLQQSSYWDFDQELNDQLQLMDIYHVARPKEKKQGEN